jgi:hypothetical protein
MSESKRSTDSSRRSFLKSTGLAALAAITPSTTGLEAQVPTVTWARIGRRGSTGKPRHAGQHSSGNGLDTFFFTREYSADCSTSVWHGALDAPEHAEHSLDVSARAAAHPRIPIYTPAEPMAWRLWPCNVPPDLRSSKSRLRATRHFLSAGGFSLVATHDAAEAAALRHRC